MSLNKSKSVIAETTTLKECLVTVREIIQRMTGEVNIVRQRHLSTQERYGEALCLLACAMYKV